MRRTASRLGVGIADQAVSSLTNFVVGVVVARSVSTAEYGAFSIAFATYLLALNASRGLATDALLVRYASVDQVTRSQAIASSTGTAMSLGLGAGLLCVCAGVIIGGTVGPAIVALGITLPGLLVQDSWRFGFFAAGEGTKTLANDLLWGGTLVLLLAAVTVSGRANQFLLTLAWGGSATVAAAAGTLQSSIVPRPLSARQWLRRNGDLSFRYFAENMAVAGGTQLRFYAIALAANLTAVGALRAAELLFGPVYVLTLGVGLIAVPEGARLLRSSPRRLRQFTLLIGSLGATAAAVWGLVLMLLMPDALGEQVLGESWVPASQLLLPTTLAVACVSFQVGALSGLRTLAAATRSLKSQAMSASVYITCAVAGALISGPVGAAWGIAVGAALSAAIYWWQLHLGFLDFADDSASAPGGRAHNQ